jgi:protein phosphatase
LLTNLHWPISCSVSHEKHFFRGLNSALEYSQNQIRSVADMYPSQSRMGTTLTMAWVVWPSTYLVHVGDTRAYLYRRGKLRLLSHDQTLAQALADNGVIKPNQVETHQFRNVLVSALGCTSNMEPQYSRHELESNDQLMICSDGLTKHLSDDEIAEILSEDNPAKIACDRLVDRANAAGGTDNITAVLGRFVENLVEDDEADFASNQIEASDEDRL